MSGRLFPNEEDSFVGLFPKHLGRVPVSTVILAGAFPSLSLSLSFCEKRKKSNGKKETRFGLDFINSEKLNCSL